jgi:hypothetical protein
LGGGAESDVIGIGKSGGVEMVRAGLSDLERREVIRRVGPEEASRVEVTVMRIVEGAGGLRPGASERGRGRAALASR